ncbi:hypothetical protein HK101_010621 [Irineochytrium annulatum]|nr:hypothetical protein HK101_010621 [Irineochytrium annulatum]
MTLDPSRTDLPVGAVPLHNACRQASKRVAASRPDCIVILTPHGLALSGSAAILLNPTASGNAEWNGYWKNYNVDVRLSGGSGALVESMQKQGMKVEGLTAFSKTSAPLRWGEVVPIHFLLECNPDVEFIVISPPSPGGSSSNDRSKTSKARIPVNLEYGRHLISHLHFLPKRVSVIVSGDLSHAHPLPPGPTNPIYLPDSRWDMPTNAEAARAFDGAVAEWVETGKGAALLQDAADIVEEAMSCGFDGMVWLQGGIEWLKAQGVEMKGTVLEIVSPTYFGMMVASFEGKE